VSVAEIGEEEIGGSCLGSRAPKSRVPVVRPRRNRTMGSSILASLSEAGGNDPNHLVNRPLPPHSLTVRIVMERDPRPAMCKSWPIHHRCSGLDLSLFFNSLRQYRRNAVTAADSFRESPSRTGTLL